jgi:hypothetical protein
MNSRVWAAGWPFAGLLALESSRADAAGESARRSGVIARDDARGGVLVYEDEDDAYVTLELDRAAAVFGVDGYPIALTDLHAGDVVQIVQEQRTGRWQTVEVRVLRRGSERSRAEPYVMALD